jgi:hypothetical protein
MTPSGIETATFLFVAQYLNHCATAVPQLFQQCQRKVLLCAFASPRRSLANLLFPRQHSTSVMSEYYSTCMTSFISSRLKHKSSPPSLGPSDVPGAGDMLSASPRSLVISGCSALSGLSAWSLPSKIIGNIYGQCGTDHLQEPRLIRNGSESGRTPRITVMSTMVSNCCKSSNFCV